MNNQTSSFNDAALDEVVGGAILHSGAQMSMLDLQSLVSRRATLLQETSNIMQSMNDASKSIAGNIGR